MKINCFCLIVTKIRSVMAFRDFGRTSAIMNNIMRKKLWVTTRVSLACFDYQTQFNSFYSSLAKN